MNISRRRFLQGTAALFCAPAIVKADNLMKIWVPPEQKIFIGVDPAATGSETEVWLLDYEDKELKHIGPKDGRVYTIEELYEWMRRNMSPENAPSMTRQNILRMPDGLDLSPSAVEHLKDGTIETTHNLYTSIASTGGGNG